MATKTMGEKISALRKEKGMTQRQLAELMNVTDKAVSKWERDLSCPDIHSIPALAQALGVTAEELLDTLQSRQEGGKAGEIVSTVLRCVPLALGVCVVVTAILGQLNVQGGFIMLGLGLSCMALLQLQKKSED